MPPGQTLLTKVVRPHPSKRHVLLESGPHLSTPGHKYAYIRPPIHPLCPHFAPSTYDKGTTQSRSTSRGASWRPHDVPVLMTKGTKPRNADGPSSECHQSRSARGRGSLTKIQLVVKLVCMEPSEIGLFETKTHLSEIIDKVQQGRTFVITKRGKRVAELRPIPKERQPLERGCVQNDEYWMAPDFDATPEDFSEYL